MSKRHNNDDNLPVAAAWQTPKQIFSADTVGGAGVFADGAVGPDLASLGEEDVAALGQIKVIGVTGAALPAEDQGGGAVDVLTADQRHVPDCRPCGEASCRTASCNHTKAWWELARQACP